MKLSDKFDDWINFSSYYNNFVAPLLTFTTIILLVFSLLVQITENRKIHLKDDKKETTNKFLSLLSMKDKIIDNIAMMDFRNLRTECITEKRIHGHKAMSEALLIYNEFTSVYLDDEKLSFINDDHTVTEYGCMEQKCKIFIPNSFRSYYSFMKSLFLISLEQNDFGVDTTIAILNANITDDEVMILTVFFTKEMIEINKVFEENGKVFRIMSAIDAQYFVREKYLKLLELAKKEKKKKLTTAST